MFKLGTRQFVSVVFTITILILLTLIMISSPIAEESGVPQCHPSNRLELVVPAIAAWNAMENKNYDKAFPIVLREAKKGNCSAQDALGVMLFNGQGVEENKQLAWEWWIKAALQGKEGSQEKLGHLYARGLSGVSVDYTKAVMWWQIAATNGNIEAQSKISELEERVMDGSASVEEARKLAEMCIASSYKAKHCDPMIDLKDNDTQKVDTEEGEPENYD